MKTKLLTICLLLFTSQVFADKVSCWGQDEVTNKIVQGYCWYNGDFEGADVNGDYYSGDCENGGGFEAYNIDTNTLAEGQCEYPNY